MKWIKKMFKKILNKIRHRLKIPVKIEYSEFDKKRLRQVTGYEKEKLLKELEHKYTKDL